MIVHIKLHRMMAGSYDSMKFGGNATEGLKGDSRRGSVWDDDDEW